MTAVVKTATSLGALPHAARRFWREIRLPMCGAVVYGLLACPGALSTTHAYAHTAHTQKETRAVPAVARGTISGTVMDGASHPVPQAEVYALITGSRVPPLSMAVPWAYTDTSGRFTIHLSLWGTYAVAADKVGAGPSPVFMFRNFYGPRRFPEVTLSPDAPAATVVVRMVPKAGILRGRIVDARTGRPITKAVYTLRREGHAGAETDGVVRAHFMLRIPSELVLNLTIHARGFQPWPETVKMAPGGRKVLTIRLRPLAPKPGTP